MPGASGAVSFTGHFDLTLVAVPDGTRLRVELRLTDTTVEAVPYTAGDEQRLFDDGLPASKWTLTHQETGKLGEIAMVYDRAC